MTRAEAIARALNPGLWDESLSLHQWKKLEEARQMALREAEKAIEANDVWLIENQRHRRGHVSADRLKLTLSDCDRAGK